MGWFAGWVDVVVVILLLAAMGIVLAYLDIHSHICKHDYFEPVITAMVASLLLMVSFLSSNEIAFGWAYCVPFVVTGLFLAQRHLLQTALLGPIRLVLSAGHLAFFLLIVIGASIDQLVPALTLTVGGLLAAMLAQIIRKSNSCDWLKEAGYTVVALVYVASLTFTRLLPQFGLLSTNMLSLLLLLAFTVSCVFPICNNKKNALLTSTKWCCFTLIATFTLVCTCAIHF